MNFFATLFVLILAACTHNTNYDQSLQEWQGQEVEVLYQQWGPPASSQQINEDEMVITYTQQQTITEPNQTMEGAPSYATNTFFDTQETYYCTTTFTIDNGIIVDYSFQGDNCED